MKKSEMEMAKDGNMAEKDTENSGEIQSNKIVTDEDSSKDCAIKESVQIEVESETVALNSAVKQDKENSSVLDES